MEIRKLNTLRGIAALIVAASHYSNITNILNGALGYGGGQIGVMIFFILSGFLMSYLYINKEFNKTEVGLYVIARIARVMPLFLIIVFGSYILQFLDIQGVLYDISNTTSLISHLALLSGTSVLWTIPAEIQFYAFFIFLWWYFQINKEYLYILIALMFLVLIFLGFPLPQGDVFGIPFIIYLFRALPYFFIGVVFGQIYGKWTPPESLRSGIFVLVLLVIPILFPKIFFLIVGHHHGMWVDIGVLFSISLVFFFLVFLVPDNNIFLTNRLGDFLGKISYSMYLLHTPVLLQLAEPAKEHKVIFFVVYLAVLIFLSYLSYLFLENPSRRMIKSVASRRLFSAKLSES